MFSTHSHQLVKKSSLQQRKRKLRSHKKKQVVSKDKPSPLATNFSQLLFDLQQPGARFLSYTIAELEPICQQIAIQQMSSVSTPITSCPWICLFCENLIYEPITLDCGHTYCEQCIKDDELSSTSMNCPRCPKDIQGHIKSSIIYARENQSSKNHFLKDIIERSEAFRFKRENILLCHKARNEYKTKNYQEAINIYSKIIEEYADDHIAFYGRAKAYIVLEQYDNALTDTEQVVLLKPHWAKGYYCRGQVLYEMKRFTTALLSSLQGLTLDPEDQTGKQLMGQHLHAVLHNKDDKDSTVSMETELSILPSSSDTTKQPMTSGTCERKLLMCKSTPLSPCLCTSFDSQNVSAKDYECSICVNLLWFPVTTPCGHVFCQECLVRSIDNTQAQCPMCKSSLEEFFPLLIQSYVNKTEIISQIIETYLPNDFEERHQLYEQQNIQGALLPKVLTDSSESVIFEIPIFVCVLTLPHCTCPLHVYEPRYRLMMRRTIETQSRTFGMCTYDEQTETFADYGTLLYIRGLIFTQDGRSIVDTIGRRRFRVIERGRKDGYDTARIQLIQDNAIDSDEFDDLHQLNRTTYQRVRDWFEQLDVYRRTLISRQLEGYPVCDDLTNDSTDGPSWAWIMLNLLPIESHLQYIALTSQSFRTRLQMINDTIDFLLTHQQQTTVSTTDDE